MLVNTHYVTLLSIAFKEVPNVFLVCNQLFSSYSLSIDLHWDAFVLLTGENATAVFLNLVLASTVLFLS